MKGSIEKRGPNSYRLVVSVGVDGSGKQEKLTRLFKPGETLSDFEKQKAAETALAEFITDIKKGKSAQSKGFNVDELFTYWMDNYVTSNLEETTKIYYENMRPRIKKGIGSMRLDQVQPKHIQSFLKNLAEPGIKQTQHKKDAKEKPPEKLSPTTVKKYHAVLSGLFDYGVKMRMMDYNPVEHVTAPKGQAKEKSIIDLETTGRFLLIMESEEVRHQLMVNLALTAGLRREEIFGLRWIDVDDSTLHIRKARVVAGTTIVTKEPKTKTSRRSVSIPPNVVALFKRHSAKEAAKQLKKGEAWKKSEFVFTTHDGDDLHPQSFNNYLTRLCKANNLPPISPHAIRHSMGTLLNDAGVDIATISKKMGHSRISVTTDVYIHARKSAEQESANTIAAILESCKQLAKDAEETKKARTI